MGRTICDGRATAGDLMRSRIPYTKPSITALEVAYATDAAQNGWGDRCYEYIYRFEEAFKTFVGSQYAIATSSCTGALHMGLAALGLCQDDEVILADTNWIATVAPVTYLGARPVFVDILPDTWCIDPEQAEAAITTRTKAIIATHLYGNLCEIEELLDIGKRHGIPIIEDSAEAIGSSWKGHPAGSQGYFGVFSFHGTKTLTTGEGGMFVTNDAALYDQVLTLSNHGRSKGQTKQFWPDYLGFKYKLSNIQAALGCAQLERIEELVERKREIFAYYRDCLEGIQGLSMNPEKPGTINGYWMPTVVFAEELGVSRDDLLQRFQEADIDARVFFWPLSSLPMFDAHPTNYNSYSICSRAINLPSSHDISESELERVITTVTKLEPLRR